MSPAWFYTPLLAQGLVWVAEDAGELIGFAACEPFDDGLHLWEVAVCHEHQGRGVGRALVARAVAEARALGLPAVTLTTFRQIPWNAPFYARLGFKEPRRLNERLRAVLEREAAKGLDPTARCAMRRAV